MLAPTSGGSHMPVDAASSHDRYLRSLPRRTWPLRTLGMGLGGLPVLVVLSELDAAWPAWAWTVFVCYLWPHLALMLARSSRDPFRAELRNWVLDSAFAGSLAPLMHFNLLPSVVLLAVVVADKLNTGIRGLWLRSLPWMVAGLVLSGLANGFALRPGSSLLVVAASLPILVLHTLAVALASYRLLRKVQRQNVQLEALSRTDALTGIASRGYWEATTQSVLAAATPAKPASLLLVDVDDFKQINDRHGHLRGDDVLRAIGALLQAHAGPDGLAGRLGGDEFALVVPLDGREADALAERLRAEALALRFDGRPDLRCSLSLGRATATGELAGLRQWMEAADTALYRAKQHGRNRAEAAGEERRRDLDTEDATGQSS
jgi:diguanylate cyclase